MGLAGVPLLIKETVCERDVGLYPRHLSTTTMGQVPSARGRPRFEPPSIQDCEYDFLYGVKLGHNRVESQGLPTVVDTT